jgi:hypothetical protein
MEGFAKSIARTLMSEFATELLGRVAVDYDLDHKTLVSRYLNFEMSEPVKKVAKAAASSSAKEMCGVITAKGTQCKFPAVEGTCKCKKHTTGDAPVKEVETVGMCSGKTAKGDPCKFSAKAGCKGLCGTHYRKMGDETPEPAKVPEPKKKETKKKEPKKKEAKKKVPADDEVSLEDLLGPEPEEKSAEEDITTRLRNILAECSDEEETVREMVSSEDEEEYEKEDNVLEQMCGSPTSREKLLAMLEEEEEEEEED